MMAKISQADLDLADQIRKFYADPLGFVMFAYDWHNDKSIQVCPLAEPWSSKYNCEYGPDEWACEFLENLGREVRERGFDGKTAVAAIRQAVVSGHGIGKSAIVAWIVDWIMSTRPFAQGTVTATTAPQLRTKTWSQIVKWTSKCITAHWFDITTGMGSMAMRHKQFPNEWFVTAQTCAEENSEAFAGQHAANSTSFYVFDEASGVPDKIDEVSEGGMTDGEPMKFAFGNGTQNTGWFAECFKRMKHRWKCWHIDSRNVYITNKQLIAEWIADHGLDSDWIKVRVRGMFPAQSSKQFISEKDVDAAFGRHMPTERYSFAPKILTLDPAWDGGDELVFGLRQGLKFDVLDVWDKNDNDMEVASRLMQLEVEHQADQVVIDKGYGTGIYSAGITAGREWTLCDFGSKSPSIGCLNMRAHIWQEMKQWLKKGGAIDGKDHDLRDELIAPMTVPRPDGVIQLESKEDMKKRKALGENVSGSPNRADALAMSFAFPAVKRDPIYWLHLAHEVPANFASAHRVAEYDPMLEASRILDTSTREYDPFQNLR